MSTKNILLISAGVVFLGVIIYAFYSMSQDEEITVIDSTTQTHGGLLGNPNSDGGGLASIIALFA